MARTGLPQIGTSGWRYPPFYGRFYPEGLPSGRTLHYYSERLDSVEINSTFYHFSRLTTYEQWRATTAEPFLIALKAHRYFTHENALRDPEGKLGEFFTRARALGPKLGPVLFQLPASFEKDLRALNQFLAQLPQDIRFTFELRHRSWHTPAVLRALEKHGAAFCIFDIRQFQAPLEVTAPFTYVRLHGPFKRPYGGPYTLEAIETWAERIRAWNRAGLDTFTFFDNTIDGAAIDNALELKAALAPVARRKAA